MSQPSDRIRTLTDPDDIRAYFAQVSEVLGTVANVIAKDGTSSNRRAMEAQIHLHYVGRLAATMRALAMKYGFSGFFTERLPSDLEIAAIGSGFPTCTEIRRLDADCTEMGKPDKRSAAGAVPGSRISPDPSPTDDEGEDLRAAMVDHILRHKTPPRDLQFLRSQRVYRRILCDEKIFGSRVEPSMIELPNAPSGCPRMLVHWGAWDAERHQPMVYMLTVEDTGPHPLAQDTERKAALFRCCQSMSQSSLQLLTIGVKIDEEFQTLHPKSLDRLVFGALQSSRFTSVDKDLASAMSHVRGDWHLDWVFAWTVESLRSRGSKKVRTGVFTAERIHEIFDVEPKDLQSVRTGTTEISRKLLMPYDVFQALRLPSDSPLADVSKYIVDLDGNVTSQS